MTTEGTPTATFIKQKNGTGDGRVYRLDPPLDGEDGPIGYVWVSAASSPYSGPETYIFPCNETGEVLSWGELKGSFEGGFDHEEALRGAGYEVAR